MDSKLLFQTMSEKENALEKEVLEIINAVNEDAYIDLKARLKEVDAETKLKIAFIGQHNAGKSTIVSALTNDSSIRISAKVETDETTEYKWGDVYLYDTPGLRAGVKDKHDKEALEAIKSSDLLVYCLTASLFDDLMIKDFVNLAYEKSYKCKMILVVNKMALEAGEFDELVANYRYSINEALEQYGAKLNDFPVAFIDAMDYKNAVADDDEELIELVEMETRELLRSYSQSIDQMYDFTGCHIKCCKQYRNTNRQKYGDGFKQTAKKRQKVQTRCPKRYWFSEN